MTTCQTHIYQKLFNRYNLQNYPLLYESIKVTFNFFSKVVASAYLVFTENFEFFKEHFS